MNSVFSMAEQFGKLPDEIIAMDTDTWATLLIWNNEKSIFRDKLTKIKQNK